MDLYTVAIEDLFQAAPMYYVPMHLYICTCFMLHLCTMYLCTCTYVHVSGCTYDISNKHRLGYSEVQLVQVMIDGVNTLYKEDVELQKKHGL